jgi:ketosteroid isomerase-like protein
MQRLWRWIDLILALTLVVVAPASSQTSDATEQVKAAEEARVAALDQSDLTALDQIVADDLTYVHASGRVDAKASFLAAIRSGQVHYISWQPLRLNVRVLGETAVLDGEYAVYVLDKRVQPQAFHVNVFFLTVYAHRNGRWQQIAWQTTRDGSSKTAK